MTAVDPALGLNHTQVQERQAAGLGNTLIQPRSKTVGQILAGNLLTYFNLINLLIFLLVLSTGRYANTLFMGVILVNTLIGIIQEIRAKRVLDQLSIVTAVHAKVLRDGRQLQITLDELVMDDIVILEPGDQVCADSIILESQALEADESLLTGESEPVRKLPGEWVLSGSFAVAGRATVQVQRIGQENYAQKIMIEAHRYKRAKSEILTLLNRIIKVISVLIIPVGVLLFANQYFRSKVSWQDGIVSSAAGMIGMIPEGLVLLTSVTLAVGVIKLARGRAVVQELPGIEVLARVDVLCLDKTGTLTQGKLQVNRLEPVNPDSGGQLPDEMLLRQAVTAMVAAFPDRNSTTLALADAYGETSDWRAVSQVPFSSARKWSGATFASRGSWLLGAPEILLREQYPAIIAQAQNHAQEGIRVILLARAEKELEAGQLPDQVIPQALLLLSDMIRPEAKPALEFFAENDVAVRIFSGDNPAAVASVAKKLGIANADRWIDASQIPEEASAMLEAVQKYVVFGRVSPQQKKMLIAALKQLGHTVAMTGDGVNDVLALREADCGIAMASGTDAAKNTAHVILLDSDFVALPRIVREGRQVINNIERVASLFLVKTTYAMALSVLFIILGLPYPFNPIHQTILGSIAIGIPAFFLALEKNNNRVHPGFIQRVIQNAVPGGLCITAVILAIEALRPWLGLPAEQILLARVMTAGIISLLILVRVASPLNLKRILLILAMAAIFIAESTVFAGLLGFARPEPLTLLVIALLGAISIPVLLGLHLLTKTIFQRKKSS